jgi:hypothetical protein
VRAKQALIIIKLVFQILAVPLDMVEPGIEFRGQGLEVLARFVLVSAGLIRLHDRWQTASE